MTEPDPKSRLAALEARIAAARGRDEPRKRHQDEHYSQAQMAWRLVIELVAGLGIGFGIGYGLDILVGTTPFLMVIFTLLGFVAGVKTMIRSANEIQQKGLLDASGDGADEEEDGENGDRDARR
ncbi:ATP synthase protein I [Roseivivax jejudonensis]|uniref:ATP synthase protein I n=1 Tax=Roseivivax jejudonensis TaxID=1529041 RepID=A0A1X7A0K3_9RHOB|nr:AtpZ/AtpI family protein [Roseivivax jejudonensis]SLN67155.1 ATP synthase protein I [Roseivivax jejudonensis]